jgi:putative Mn2+ efflux pump MntP
MSEIKTKSGVKIFGNSDYRGVIAIILVIAFVFSLFEDKVAAMVLGPFAGVVITWYFKEWNSRNANNQ